MLSSITPLPAAPTPLPAASGNAADKSGNSDSFAQALNDATPADAKPAAKNNGTRAKTRTSASPEHKHGRDDGPSAGRAPGIESAAEGQPPDNGERTDQGPARRDDVSGLLADLQALHSRTANPPAPAAAASGNEAPVDATAAASKLQALPQQALSQAPRQAAADSATVKAHTAPPMTESDDGGNSATTDNTEYGKAHTEATGLPSPQPSLAAAAAPAPQAAASATRTETTLGASPTSAEFAPQFAATISTFVRGGVEHARLHLNPAEMGPVLVQIQIDGTNAQVLMSADHALTRQALEHSLPLLAGSLREAGLTLAGGGVFEQRQPGQDGNGEGNNHSTPRRAQPEPEPSRHPPPPAQRRGVVDLIA
jgi:flagellar hook-length control protein FliK